MRYDMNELYQELQQKAAEKEAEQNEAFKKKMAALNAEEEARKKYWSDLLDKASKKIDSEKKAAMERKIQEETEAAADAIRRKYEAEFPADWNESPETKAWKSLVKELYPDGENKTE